MYNIGIDLGGTNMVAGLVNKEGHIEKKLSVSTNPNRLDKDIVISMAELAKDLLKEANLGINDIYSVGIGSPGIVNPITGVIEYANNIPFRDTRVRDEFTKILPVPVFMGNDANLAAYGEFISGAGATYKNLVAITLGTGVGAGIILDGKIMEGSYYAGAELGHMVIKQGGKRCTCGRKGCLEQYASASALKNRAIERARKNPKSMLNDLYSDISQINGKDIFDTAAKGDKEARKVVKRYIKYLASGLVNIISIFQPEAIIIGGGVSAQGENLLIPLKARVRREVYAGSLKTEIKIAELGNDAGIIGAGMLYKLYGTR